MISLIFLNFNPSFTAIKMEIYRDLSLPDNHQVSITRVRARKAYLNGLSYGQIIEVLFRWHSNKHFQ